MQGKRSKAKNLTCQECKQKEKSSHTGKIRKQKQDKKVLASRVGLGGKFPANVRKSHVPLI